MHPLLQVKGVTKQTSRGWSQGIYFKISFCCQIDGNNDYRTSAIVINYDKQQGPWRSIPTSLPNHGEWTSYCSEKTAIPTSMVRVDLLF